MSMTLATTWVRRGVAAQFPTKYEVDEAELGRIEKLARLQLEDAQHDLNNAQGNPDGEDDSGDSEDGADTSASDTAKKGTTTNDDDLKEYHLSDYDDDPIDDQG